LGAYKPDIAEVEDVRCHLIEKARVRAKSAALQLCSHESCAYSWIQASFCHLVNVWGLWSKLVSLTLPRYG